MHRMHRWWIFGIMITALLMLPRPASTQGATQLFFSVQELGPSQLISGVNQMGQWFGIEFDFETFFFSGFRASIDDPTPSPLALAEGSAASAPAGNNNFNQIVGAAVFDSEERSGRRAALWQPNGVVRLINRDLGFHAEARTEALDINERGGVVGSLLRGDKSLAFLSLRGQRLFVEKQESFALKLNNAGLAVGALIQPLPPGPVGTKGHGGEGPSVNLPTVWYQNLRNRQVTRKIIGGGSISGIAQLVNERGLAVFLGQRLNDSTRQDRVFAWLQNQNPLQPDFLREIHLEDGVRILSIRALNDQNEFVGLAENANGLFPYLFVPGKGLIDLQSAIPTIGINLFEPISLDNQRRIIIRGMDVQSGEEKLLLLTPGAG